MSMQSISFVAEQICVNLSMDSAQRVEEDMDKLWDEGLWDQDKNEAIIYAT